MNEPSLSELNEPSLSKLKVDWVHFLINEDDEEMIIYCKLKREIPNYLYMRYNFIKEEYEDVWYTYNPNIFLAEFKKNIKVENNNNNNNNQSILDLFKKNGLTVKSSVKCTKCLVEHFFPYVFVVY